MEKEERSSYEKERLFLIKTAYVATILLLIWMVFHYVVPVIMPFLIAFVIAWMCMPLVQWLANKTKLKNRKIWGITVIFLLYVSLGSFATWLIFKVTGWIGTIVKKIPDFYYDSVLPALKNALSWSEKWFETFSPELLGQYRSVINDVIKSITNGILSLSGEMASMITSFSLALPNFFITVSFAILASMFIAWDFERITQFFKRQLSDRTLSMMETAKVSFQTSIKDYVKAYVVIALITFTELSIGFYVIGLPNPIGVAAGIAIFDMIPVFGTGGIMVPWVLIELLNGDFTLAIQLLVIYGIVTLVRNVIEPKIVGQKLGLNSVLALFVMYVGLKLFGFLGMIAAPILTVMLKNFHDKENLNWWK
ncbi:sporulation integral membrane protein YtvI [Planococcaceae bacterium Storch 2/2-2]|nr:sporulation integral membrane protein YtvI [Planococcaceae bacterium Storch 2/2-2]